MALQFEPEVGHARWFVDGDSDWQRLCSIGPSGFARYVRVLHPDDDDDDGVGDEHPDGVALARLLRVLGAAHEHCAGLLLRTVGRLWTRPWRVGSCRAVHDAAPAGGIGGGRPRS